MYPPYGLHRVDGDKDAIPLQGVEVKVAVLDFLAEVTVEQRYKNEGSDPIEAVYTFPLESEAVVKAFRFTVDGRTAKGQVQETEQAKDTYDDALASGHGAALLTQDQSMKDVFSVRVGNLPPGSEATITLTYATQVPEEVDAKDPSSSQLRLLIPTAVAPRYRPVGSSTSPSELPAPPGVGLVQWARRKLGGGKKEGEQGASKEEEEDLTAPPHNLLQIRGSVTSSTRIVGVEVLSLKDQAQTRVEDGGRRASFVVDASDLAEDLVVAIKQDGRLQDRAWIDRSGAVMVAAGLRPGQLDDLQNDSLAEYIFIVDRSGSMGGSKMSQAKEALALSICAMPEGATFNIVSFGSSFSSLWPESVAFDQDTKAQALSHCESMDANMGGTEILQPLRHVALKPPSDRLPRQTFVLTDGEVFNTQAVLDFVAKDARQHGTRYFSIGIGSGASSALVQGLAEKGGGAAEMVVDGERMHGKVIRQMERALQPSLTNVHVQLPQPIKLLSGLAPRRPKPLYPGTRLLFFGLVDPATAQGVTEVTLQARSPDGDVSVAVPLTATPQGEGYEALLQALASKAVLKELEEQDEEEGGKTAEVKDQAVSLSVSSGVTCKWTSYVAVDHRTDPVTGSLKPVILPLTIISAPQELPLECQSMALGAMPMRRMLAAPSSFAMPSFGMAMKCSAPPPPPCPSAPVMMFSAPAPGGGGGGGAIFDRAAAMSSPVKMAAPKKKMKEAVRGRGSSFQDDEDEEQEEGGARGGGGVVRGDDHVAIVATQKVGGSWSLEEWLAQALHTTLAKLQEAGRGAGVGDEEWATALVLSLLTHRCQRFSGEWEMSARKARKWLGRQQTGRVDELMAKADKLVVG